MRSISLFLLLLSFATAWSQPIQIIPQPVEVKSPPQAGKFLVTPTTQLIIKNEAAANAADFFNEYLKRHYGFSLKITKQSNTANAIHLAIKPKPNSDAIKGAYTAQINAKGIVVTGDNSEGVFYGIQTLIQLLPVTSSPSSSLAVPFVFIRDYPRFEYRGLHLDVCRHFFPVDYVKKYIDYIALHKMNRFHWHLTDDQGWRIEIKKYPRLTEVGGTRAGTIIGRYPGTGNDSIQYSDYYTQEQIKDVIAYAAARYITIIPEIEMPGHASAAIAAYPQLSCFPDESTRPPARSPWWAGDSTGKHPQQTWGIFPDVFCPSEYTFNFLEDVLEEVIALFPSTYIHIGGDECPKDNWKRSVFCQQLIKDLDLKDEHGLQSYFVQRMEKFVNSKGRKIIGWDEILEGGLAPNATVMSWRGEKGGITAASQNHDVIMTPSSHLYLDHKQTEIPDSVTIGNYTPLEKTYSYEPVSAKLPPGKGKYILGAQGNLWTEYIGNTRKVEYMLFPRATALSEVLWSPKAHRNYASFEKRLKVQTQRYALWGANYNPTYK